MVACWVACRGGSVVWWREEGCWSWWGEMLGRYGELLLFIPFPWCPYCPSIFKSFLRYWGGGGLEDPQDVGFSWRFNSYTLHNQLNDERSQ